MSARGRAARSLAWATYACDPSGVVAVGQDTNEGWWFSDGYGDYIRHFLVAMGAVPEWAPPNEDHLLRSTSVVTHVEYAPGRVAWSTFDDDSVETLRLAAAPSSVTMAGRALPPRADLDDEGYLVEAAGPVGAIVRVRHRSPGELVVASGEPPAEPAADPGGAAGVEAAAGCSVSAQGRGPGEAAWAALGLFGLFALRRR